MATTTNTTTAVIHRVRLHITRLSHPRIDEVSRRWWRHLPYLIHHLLLMLLTDKRLVSGHTKAVYRASATAAITTTLLMLVAVNSASDVGGCWIDMLMMI